MNDAELEDEPSSGDSDLPMDPLQPASSGRNERGFDIDTARKERSLPCGPETLKPILTDTIHDPSLTHCGDFGHTASGVARIDVSGARRADDLQTPRESAQVALLGRSCGSARSVVVHPWAADSGAQPDPHGASNGVPHQIHLELEGLRREISELRLEVERNRRFDDNESLPSYRT